MKGKKKKEKHDIGIAIDPPKKSCEDDRCPWHGHLKVRGQMLSGKVLSVKSLKTVIIEFDYFGYVPKYERYERKRSNIAAHRPECIELHEGDVVQIVECRRISKTKSFVVVGVLKSVK